METPEPMLPLIEIDPPPERRLKFDPPSIVLRKVMLPTPALKSKLELSKSVTPLVIRRLPWTVTSPATK